MPITELDELRSLVKAYREENDRLKADGEAAATALVKYVVENKSSPLDGMTARKNWEAGAKTALRAVKLYMINVDGLHQDPGFADDYFETARSLFNSHKE